MAAQIAFDLSQISQTLKLLERGLKAPHGRAMARTEARCGAHSRCGTNPRCGACLSPTRRAIRNDYEYLRGTIDAFKTGALRKSPSTESLRSGRSLTHTQQHVLKAAIRNTITPMQHDFRHLNPAVAALGVAYTFHGRLSHVC